MELTTVKIVGLDPEVNDLYKHHFQTRDQYIGNLKTCISRVLEHKHLITITQEISFHMSDGRAKVIKFANGKQVSSYCVRRTVLGQRMEYGNGKIPYELTQTKITTIEDFDCSSAKWFDAKLSVSIECHCPFIADGWRLVLQVSKESKTSVDFYRAKEFKAKLFVPVTSENFLSIIPWKNGDSIFILLEKNNASSSTGSICDDDLGWVVNSFAPTLIDKCSLQVQDIYIRVADKTGFEVNKFYTGEYAIKQLMPRVATMDHSNFAEFIMSIDRYFITDKVNGITTVCAVVNDIIYIAGGNETYDFPLVGFNGWIFDAELIVIDGKYTLFPFDIRHAEQPLHNMPFATRQMYFEKLVAMNRQLREITIVNKRWLNLALGQDKIAEFHAQSSSVPYPTDGYVFVYSQRLEYKHSMYQATRCYKWKPQSIITVDFYVTECKLPIKSDVKDKVPVVLCNGIDAKLKFVLPDLIPVLVQSSDKYLPVRFSPSGNPYNHIAYIDKDRVNEVVGNICEFTMTEKGWHLERVRGDRINELMRGLSFGNDHRIAELNLFTIEHPIKIEDIINTRGVEHINNMIKKIGPVIVLEPDTTETIHSIYNNIRKEFIAKKTHEYVTEYIVDHTICGFILEKEKGSKEDIVHIMVTKSEVNVINYINMKYMSSSINKSYYVFGDMSNVAAVFKANTIRYPVVGGRLIISMFACEATTVLEAEIYLRHMKNIMHDQGRIIICWCEAFGQSIHGFELLTQASKKCGLMINEVPHQVRNPRFTNFHMYVLNK